MSFTAIQVSPVQAATFVGNRDALRATDFLDWSVVGDGSLPPFPSLPNSFSTTSAGGLDLNVRIPDGSFLRIDQTPFFPGAFDVGDALLFTGLANPGPLTITFDAPVFGGGVQIQSDPMEIPDYTATIEAFDSFGNTLGVFERDGVSISDAGGGVIFVGVFDRGGDIKNLVFNAQEQGANGPFAINALSLKTSPETVPEPGVLLGISCLGLGFLSKKGSRR